MKRQIKEGVIVPDKKPAQNKTVKKKKKGDSNFKSDSEFDRKKGKGSSEGVKPSSKKIFKKKKHLGGKKK